MGKKRSNFIKIFIALNIILIFLGFSLIEDQPNFNEDLNTSVAEPDNFPSPLTGCLASGCHDGLAPIRNHSSKMAQAIYDKGVEMNDPNGCVVCHFGDATEEKIKKIAHKDLVKYPGSMWVKDRTCGQCHTDHCYMMERNLMQSEAGKIQGALWGWGAQTGYKPIYGNYKIDDPDGSEPRIGTEAYKEYMKLMIETYPDNFPTNLKLLPEANPDEIADNPEQAVFTYLRAECQRCHVGVRGVQRRGDYRGTGCAACHIPFSDEGFYEGKDKSIPTDETGHMLVHSIQSSRKAKVTVNDKTYSGIPSETCTSCHNRGKRIGVSFLGIIETPYNTPFGENNSVQPKLHGKKYMFINDDAHHKATSREGNPSAGLLCQDCHNSSSVHGNGNIGGTTLGEVEIECSDCHGTPEKYPWELPLGFMDEFGINRNDTQRGLSQDPLNIQKIFSTDYPAEDGYLLTSRGNPMGNVIKRENTVIVHSASGYDFQVPDLKNLAKSEAWKNPKRAQTAMVKVKNHMQKLECYSCHASWAPQCYGCHVKVDYSDGKTSNDWVKSGNTHFANGETVETMEGENMIKLPGKATEGRSYMRWEDPTLGINGEGRVTPIIPGCQQITTVIGEDGESIITSKIWRTPPGMENSGEKGQRGIDMTPVQPHTISATARSCTSCHANPKALGYGIEGGIFLNGYQKERYIDLRNSSGENISENSTPQFNKIEDLDIDLSQVVTRDGEQVQTVGHHWPLSSPLKQGQREKMERVGICLSCHQDLPDGTVPISILTKAGEMTGLTPHTDDDHMKLLNSDIRLAARSRFLIPVLLFILLFIGFIAFRKRKELKRVFSK